MMKLKWFGHAAFELDTDNKKIYIDPFSLPIDFNIADLILITHEHYDHCDLEDIKKIQGEKTIIVTTETTAQKVPGNVNVVKEGDTYNFHDILIKALPAYNLNKVFHPRGLGVGFLIVTKNGKKIYHAGDTDFIPEMENLAKEEIDVLLLPVGGKYTMDVTEAVEAAKSIEPRIAIPMHYAKIVGSKKDAENFKEKIVELNLGVKSEILKEGETLKF